MFVICGAESVNNKLRIRFGEDKTKAILFFTKKKKRKIETLHTKYGNINVIKYSKVTYLGRQLDKNLSGKVMALKVISKISGRLRFL